MKWGMSIQRLHPRIKQVRYNNSGRSDLWCSDCNGEKKIISGSHMSKNVPFWPLFPPEWTHVVKVSWTPPPPLGEHENTQKGSLVLRNVSLRKGIWLSVLLLKSNSCNHRKPHLYFQDVNYRCHYLYTLLLSFLPFCFLYFSHLDSAVNCHPRLLLLTCPCSI